jgi:hypothetical protein
VNEFLTERLGRTKDGLREGTAYTEHREDPTVGSAAQELWSNNASLVNELAPYHVHEDSAKPTRIVTVGGYLQ